MVSPVCFLDVMVQCSVLLLTSFPSATKPRPNSSENGAKLILSPFFIKILLHWSATVAQAPFKSQACACEVGRRPPQSRRKYSPVDRLTLNIARLPRNAKICTWAFGPGTVFRMADFGARGRCPKQASRRDGFSAKSGVGWPAALEPGAHAIVLLGGRRGPRHPDTWRVRAARLAAREVWTPPRQINRACLWLFLADGCQRNTRALRTRRVGAVGPIARCESISS